MLLPHKKSTVSYVFLYILRFNRSHLFILYYLCISIYDNVLFSVSLAHFIKICLCVKKRIFLYVMLISEYIMFGRSESDPYRLYLPIYWFNMVQNYRYRRIRTSSDILNFDNRVEFLLSFFSGSDF